MLTGTQHYKPDFQTAEEPSRPQYRQSLQIFSPSVTGMPPRHPTEVTLKPSFKPSPQNQFPLSTSSQQTGTRMALRNEESDTHRQSALASFVEERRSSQGQQQSQEPMKSRNLIGSRSRQTQNQERGDASSSYLDARSQDGMSGRLNENPSTSSHQIMKTRSSSAIIIGADSSGGGHRMNHTESSHDLIMTSEENQRHRQSHSQLQVTYQNEQRRRAARQEKKVRTMKDRKDELKEDRKAKAYQDREKHRKKKEHKHKSRSRKQPEVVVLYRYPPPSSTNKSSSYHQTQSSSTLAEGTGKFQNAELTSNNSKHHKYPLHKQSITEESSQNYTPNLKHKPPQMQVLSIGSQGHYIERDAFSSGAISPSELANDKQRHRSSNLRDRQADSRHHRHQAEPYLDPRGRSREQRSTSHEMKASGKRSSKSRFKENSRHSQSRLESRQEKSANPTSTKHQVPYVSRAQTQEDERPTTPNVGIALYRPSSREDCTSSKRHIRAPLTSSQLADDYQFTEKSQAKKTKNESFLYYQRLQQQHHARASLSSRPQEVVLAKQVAPNKYPKDFKESPRPTSTSQGRHSQGGRSKSRNRVETEKSEENSSKFNLANYREIMSQKEQLLARKMSELKNLNQQISTYKDSIPQLDQSIQQHWRQSISSSADVRDPTQHNTTNQNASQSTYIVKNIQSSSQDSLMKLQPHQIQQPFQLQRGRDGHTDETSPRRPKSQIGQSYINYLERNRSRSNNSRGRINTEGGKESLLDAHPQVIAPLPPPPKPIVNAKQYAISKMIGQLNTKREFNRVSMNSVSQNNTSSTMQPINTSAYDDNYLAKTYTGLTVNQQASFNPIESVELRKDESKSSFIRRFERYQDREALRLNKSTHQGSGQIVEEYGGAESRHQESDGNPKYMRSQSHLDLKSETRFWQSRAELIYEQQDSLAVAARQKSSEQRESYGGGGIPNSNHIPSRQRSSENIMTYYTLGAAEQHLQSFKDRTSNSQNNHNQGSTFQYSASSPLRNSPMAQVQVQPDFRMIMQPHLESLITRADRMVTASKDQLQVIVENPSVSDNSQAHYNKSHTDATHTEITDRENYDQTQGRSQEEPQVRSGKGLTGQTQSTIGGYSALDLYGHRIAELQRQTDELQKAPDFFNERVANLKQQTLELHQLAKNYTSGEKKVPSQRVVPEDDLNQRISVENTDDPAQQNFKGFHAQHKEFQRRRMPSAHDDSSFVKQHDITSSFLREEQFRSNGIISSSGYTNNRKEQTGLFQQELIPLPPSSYHYDQSSKTTRNLDAAEYDAEQVHEIQMPITRLGQSRDRSQVFSQQITMQKPDSQVNELELTRKLEKQVLSMGDTNRLTNMQKSMGEATRTEQTADEGQQELRASRKKHRQEKRDRKLAQLKELHDKAQQSMTKIASELISQGGSEYNQGASFRRNFRGAAQSQNQLDVHSSVAISQEEQTDPINTYTDRRETVRSKVEKLANTRKEIKRLIKIQNKHSKVLRQLQHAGVIQPSNSSIPQDSFASISEMSESQKQHQAIMSSNLLQQMQDVFTQLAEVQQKLDFEIAERKKRNGQLNQDHMSHLKSVVEKSKNSQLHAKHESNRASNHAHSQEYEPQLYNASFNPHFNDMQASKKNSVQRNHELSQGTTSTLFWETQMAAQAQCNTASMPSPYHPLSLNGQRGQQQERGDRLGTQSSLNCPPAQIHESHKDEIETIQQHEQQVYHDLHNDLQNKDDKVLIVPATPVSAPDGTQVTECDQGDIEGIHNVHDMATITASEQLNMMHKGGAPMSVVSGTDGGGSSVMQNIRVEQLCDILSKEISRVREESVQQAQEMHMQYENELQALRQEFFAKQAANIHNRPSSGFKSGSAARASSAARLGSGMRSGSGHRLGSDNRAGSGEMLNRVIEQFGGDSEDAAQNTQTMEQMLLRQTDRSKVGSDGCTPRTQTVSDRILSMRQNGSHQAIYHDRIRSEQMPTQLSGQPVEVQILSDPNYPSRPTNYATEMHQSVFQELEKVKAERDLYYSKLMKVRQRIELGKTARQQAFTESSREGFPSSLRDVKQEIVQSEDANSEQLPPQPHSIHEKPQVQVDFMPVEIPRAVQSVSEMTAQQKQIFYPSLEAPMNIIDQNMEQNQQQQTSTFQHDSGEILQQEQSIKRGGGDIHNNTLQTQDSNPQPRPTSQQSSTAMLKPPSFLNEAAKASIQSTGLRPDSQTKQAGKIVHQFRSYQESAGSIKNIPQKPRAGNQLRRSGDQMRKSGDYVPVRHNRTSMLRQNKHVKESLVQRCQSCLFSSADVSGSNDRSCLSGHSGTSGTRKNVKAKAAVHRESSAEWCKNCSQRVDGQTLSQINMPAPFMQDTVSQSSNGRARNALQKQRIPSSNDHLTFSNNKGFNSTNQSLENKNSSQEVSHQLPSARIGGQQQMQSMVPRSPSLINRLAAEHEIYLHQMQRQESAEFNQNQMEQTGGPSHDDCHFTLDQDRASKALSVISHYLEKYDRQSVFPAGSD